MNDFIIILPTHSDYIGITKNFIQLLRKNWPDCPFEIVVSVTGELVKVDKVKNLYNGKNASLIDCVVNVAKKYKKKYYLSFLGDAFINGRIDNVEIQKILKSLLKNKVAYCSLLNVKNYKKKKNFDKQMRYINGLDRYSHNFTAFAASYDFVKRDLSLYKTDLDFEKEYLSETRNFYYDDRLVLRKNYFKLLPSIVKGEWDRINYKKLVANNPEIKFETRKFQSLKNTMLCHTRNVIVMHLPAFLRIRLKSATERIFGLKFGVEG